MVLANNVRLTKYLMCRDFLKEFVDAVFDFANLLDKMNLTTREISLLLPVTLTNPGKIIYFNKYK